MPKCGTISQYQTHRFKKEVPCDECKTAKKEYQKAYMEKNKDKMREYHTAYFKNNREMLSAYKLKWQKSNPDKVKEMTKRWVAKNPEKVREIIRARDRIRRARKQGQEHEHYTEKEVLSTYGTDCYLCLTPIDLNASRKAGVGDWEKGLHMDHVIPLSKGGGDNISNVKPAHAKCNLIKNARVYASKEE